MEKLSIIKVSLRIMNKIISIHQPNFLPWIGYFFKIANSDTFVLLDDVQYTKNSFINRNKIKTPSGAMWLTIPVLHSGRQGQNINDTILSSPEKSYRKITSSLKANYSKSKYYNEIMDLLIPAFEEKIYLSVLNINLIIKICNYLEIGTEIIRSSRIQNVEGTATDRLVSICDELQASIYLAGYGSVNYQESDKFKLAGIKSEQYKFQHPNYDQLWGDFIPNLSIIDLLFNCGPQSKNYLFGNN